MKLEVKVLRHQKFEGDAEWLENFLQQFPNAATSYFVKPTDTDILESYGRDYWQLRWRMKLNIPHAAELLYAFTSEEFRKAAHKPAEPPSALGSERMKEAGVGKIVLNRFSGKT